VASGGSRTGVWWGSQIEGNQEGLHLLKYQRFSTTIVGCHTKVVTICRPKKWIFLLVELRDISGNNHSLKALYIINSENVWSRSQTAGLIFHKLHISHISTKCIEKVYSKAGVANRLNGMRQFFQTWVEMRHTVRHCNNVASHY